VDGPANLVAAQSGDHPLDMTPMAEARDIAIVAAALGAQCGLEYGVVAVALDQFGCIGKRDTAVDEGAIHDRRIAAARFATADKCRQRIVDHAAADRAMALPPLLCHGARMIDRTTRAGGCFLTVFILAGFIGGLAIRNPLKGVLIGTATGAVLALATWLIDRRRRR